MRDPQDFCERAFSMRRGARSLIKPGLRRRLAHGLLLWTAFTLLAQPVLAAPPRADSASERLALAAAGGEAYLNGVGEAALRAAELAAAVEAVYAAPLAQLSEEAVAQARRKALEVAEQSAIALGAADDLADGIQALGGVLPAALDVGQAASEGLPEQMALDLIEVAGLQPGQVAELEAGLQSTAQARLGVGSGGLPEELVSQLQAAGFTPEEIERVEQALGVWGLADGSLATRLDQFRASQDEMAGLRTRALILAVQLLGAQIAVRQAHGIPPRPVSEEELAELAGDELRLLIHAAHLAALWGEDPRLEVGEGDWWFIERYAGRAAERLERLTLETQNRALVVDLLLVLQMKTLALSARSGDAEYVRGELDRLAELLEAQVGAASALVAPERKIAGLTKVLARAVGLPWLRERVTWLVEEEARDRLAQATQGRLAAHGVERLASPEGAFEELDERNNQLGLLFAAGLPFFGQLEAYILQAALDLIAVINDGTMLAWIEAILTGQTDDPALLAASAVFSLIPVLGVIPDLVSLVVEASIFIKALSIVGIIGSLGDLVGLIPGLQGVGGASFLGDAAAAVIKALFRYIDDAARVALNGLRLTEAFEVVLDLLKVTVRLVGDTLGGSLEEVKALLGALFTGGLRLWDDFVAFARRAGSGLLVSMGFDEGGRLVGGILRRGVSLSDEALRVVDSVGDDLLAAGIRLGDEAANGMGRLGGILDEPGMRRYLTAAECVLGSVALRRGGTAKLARVIERPAGSQQACEAAGEFVETLGRRAVPIATFTGDTFEEIGRLLARRGDSYTSALLAKLSETTDDVFDTQVRNILRRVNADEALEALLEPTRAPEIRDGVISLVRRLDHPRISGKFRYGFDFQLARVEHYASAGGGNRLAAVELREALEDGNVYYDLVLDSVSAGPIVEVKYWTRGTLQRRLDQVVQQIVDRVRTQRGVIAEFGLTKTDPILGLNDPFIRDFIEALEEQGISVSTDPSTPAQVLISLIQQ